MWKLSSSPASGAAGKCPDHGPWVWCDKHKGSTRGCPACEAAEKKKREEEAEQERRRREEAEKARQREIAEIPLEERAARAAEEKKQKQAAQQEVYRRSVRDDIVPHAVDIVQDRLGVTTNPDDWVMPDDDSTQKCLTLMMGGVSVMVLHTYETDTDKVRWSDASGESYGNSHFYRGWVYNQASEEWQQLTLASFGEAQNAQPPSKGSGMPAFRDMWSMMLAITESDAQAIDTIWHNGDHVKMFTWAMSTITALLQGEGLDPADYARRALAKAAVDEAEGKVY
jgi:uncharacterized Zn finger protein (UPF0148 family)